jgi:hypothetical protein
MELETVFIRGIVGTCERDPGVELVMRYIEIHERRGDKADLDDHKAATLEAMRKAAIKEFCAPTMVMANHNGLLTFPGKDRPERLPDRERDFFGEFRSRFTADIVFSEDM